MVSANMPNLLLGKILWLQL